MSRTLDKIYRFVKFTTTWCWHGSATLVSTVEMDHVQTQYTALTAFHVCLLRVARPTRVSWTDKCCVLWCNRVPDLTVFMKVVATVCNRAFVHPKSCLAQESTLLTGMNATDTLCTLPVSSCLFLPLERRQDRVTTPVTSATWSLISSNALDMRRTRTRATTVKQSTARTATGKTRGRKKRHVRRRRRRVATAIARVGPQSFVLEGRGRRRTRVACVVAFYGKKRVHASAFPFMEGNFMRENCGSIDMITTWTRERRRRRRRRRRRGTIGDVERQASAGRRCKHLATDRTRQRHVGHGVVSGVCGVRT